MHARLSRCAVLALFCVSASATGLWAQLSIPLATPPCEILDSPIVGTDNPVPPAVAVPNPAGEQIRTLALRIVTSNDFFSDTHDDVWLDIGPKAWKIGNQFERGSTRSINIDLS